MTTLLLLAFATMYRLSHDSLVGPSETAPGKQCFFINSQPFGPFGHTKGFAVERECPLLCTFPVLSNWFSQDPPDRPPEIDPVLNLPERHPAFFCPSRDTLRCPVKREYSIGSSIPRLFRTGRPPTILRGVVALVVNSFKLVGFRRTFSHVLQEPLKRLSPTNTNRDATASVPWIANVAGRLASANHRSPALVRDRFCHSVRCTSLDSGSTSETSATAFCAFLQAVPICKCFTSALTNALPNKQSVFVSPSERHDCQPTELLADGNLACVISEWPLRAFGRINNWLDILRHDFLPLVGGSLSLLYQLAAQESI